ncbi:MAG: hypothetical protein JSW27_21640, partial [Phycisphaerales bacterium]
MTMRQGVCIVLMLLAALGVVGCKTTVVKTVQYDRPLPPGQLALRKITDPNRFPDFSGAWYDLNSLRQAIGNSLNYLSKASSQQFFPYGDINHEQAVNTLETFLTLIDSGVRPGELTGVIHAHFDVYM